MNVRNTRIVMSLFGVIVCGISIGMFKAAALGIDPFQCLVTGTHRLFPISYGTIYIIINVVLLTFSLFTDRKNIGLATFINLFFLGYIIDYSHSFFSMLMPSTSIRARFFLLILAVIVLCFSSAFYMTAELGISTYDAIANVMAYKWHIAPFKYCRIATDFVCVIIGTVLFLMTGIKLSAIPTLVGLGTIITAFFMGPLIEFFNEKAARPFLSRAKNN